MKINSSLSFKSKNIVYFYLVSTLVLTSSVYSLIELDSIKGSSQKDFQNVEFELKIVKLDTSDNGIKIKTSGSSTGLTEFNQRLEGFLESSSEINYSMLSTCKPEINSSNNNSSLVISLKNPLSGKEYFLELNYPASRPNNTHPRNPDIEAIEVACNKVRKELKQDIDIIKNKIGLLTQSAKQFKDTKKDNSGVKKQDSTVNRKNLEKEINDLKSKKEKIEITLKTTKEKSKNLLDKKSENTVKVKDSEKTLDKTKKEIADIQNQLKELENKKKEIQGTLDKILGVSESKDPKTTDETQKKLTQKYRDHAKASVNNQNKVDEVVDSSEKAQELKGDQAQIQSQLDNIDSSLQGIKTSSANKEKEDNAIKAETTDEKCKALKKKQDKLGEDITKLKEDLKKAIEEKKKLLEDKTTKKSNLMSKRQKINNSIMSVLTEMDTCFVFRTGFIPETKKSFAYNSADAINFIKSIKPNSNNYNLVDKIYITTVKDPCGVYKTQTKKLRKKDKKKLRKEENKEKKLNNSNNAIPTITNSKANGLIYNKNENTPVKLIDYKPSDNNSN